MEEEIAACFPVIQHLRPHLDHNAFMAAITRMKGEGYRLVFIADPEVRAVAGFRRMEALSTGVVLFVDDLVTLPEHRSRGYGKQLLDWLLEQAKKENCQYLELDSGVKRLDAHRFYEREGMGKTAFHFSKPAMAKAVWEGKP